MYLSCFFVILIQKILKITEFKLCLRDKTVIITMHYCGHTERGNALITPMLIDFSFRRLQTILRTLDTKSQDGDRILRSPQDFSDISYLYGASGLRHLILDQMENRKEPTVFSKSAQVFYCCVPADETLLLLGPVRFVFPARCRDDCTIPLQGQKEAEDHFQQWLVSVPECDFDEFIDCSLLFDSRLQSGQESLTHLHTSAVRANFLSSGIDGQIKASYMRKIFDNGENNFVHNTYNHEMREVEAVERGKLKELKQIIDENYTGHYGNLSHNPLRQEIDMGIIVVTLASRAAIRGGVSYETAFSLSDSSINLLESCRDVVAARHIYRQAELEYCRLVSEQNSMAKSDAKNEENKHISHCKDYIYSHLHSKLTVQDIASAIGLEPNYLSALFRKYEKITLKQYIIRAKINLVENLLTYSQYSYSEIASYLCFSSQSHMTEQFRKVTGMTPRSYREKYQRDDFLLQVR